jgi:hypothetical protein
MSRPVLCLIYLPTAAVSWGLLGTQLSDNVLDSLCDGSVKILAELMFLVHLVSTFPIILNPPNQFFEGLLNIPTSRSQLSVGTFLPGPS